MALFATAAELGELLGRTFTGAELTQANAALELASAQIQSWTRQQIERVVDDDVILLGGSSWELELPEHPVETATVTAIDGVEPTAGSYRLLGSTLIRPGGWVGPGVNSANWPAWDGRYLSVVEITYTHGFESIPDDIRAACLQIAARAIQNPAGVRQEQVGSYSVTYAGGDGGTTLVAADEALLGRYRRRVAAVKIQ